MIRNKKRPIPLFQELTPQEAQTRLKTDMVKVITNIRNRMQEIDVDQRELTDRISSDESRVSFMLNLEKAKYKNGLTIAVIGRIAYALNCSTADLLK